MNRRQLLANAGQALLDQARDLTLAELGALAELPDDAVPSLAALAHEVRLARLGPRVEVEGILSAKSGGCPEDCHFSAPSPHASRPLSAPPHRWTSTSSSRPPARPRRSAPASSAS